ncbi:hypothetical protein O988_00197 [Pseudogymnoascus sp. VKM F-3808]|nr:hypothetical protein O988_00197 [Pseudogymnoascus sp. VKM F-3808]
MPAVALSPTNSRIATTMSIPSNLLEIWAPPPHREHLIINEIPLGPEQYKEWLKNEREAHSKLKERLDIQICTVPEAEKARLAMVLDTWGPNTKEYLSRQSGAKGWRFDHEGPHGFLEHPPRALLNEGFDLWIHDIDNSWTNQIYTINLDRETFSVDNRTFYNLWDIPRHCKTKKSPQAETLGRTPQPLPFSIDIENYFGNNGDRDEYQSIYHQYDNSVITAIGRYYFVELSDYQRFIGYDHMGYIVDRSIDDYHFNYLFGRMTGKESVLPIFGSECHEPGICPGSAPLESLYWFENVLVSLVPDSIFRHDTEAAVAKAVEYGFGGGKTSFQIILFSIFNVILLEAYLKDGVKVSRRTEVISIQDRDRTSRWTLDPNKYVFQRETDVATTFQQVCHKHMGFTKLQNFFDVAARRNMPPSCNERLPVELYANIISYVDLGNPRTLHVMSQVSWTVRELCSRRFAFSEDLDVCGFNASSKAPRSDIGVWRWSPGILKCQRYPQTLDPNASLSCALMTLAHLPSETD